MAIDYDNLLKSCGITKSHLAKELGMVVTTLKNKLNENHAAKLTEEDERNINRVLLSISKRLKDGIKNNG